MSDQKTPPAEDSPLGEIKLAPKRPTITIDDEPYELALLEYDFSVVAHHELERDIERFDALWGKDKLSRRDGEQLTALLAGLFDRVTRDWPADLVERLTDVQKRQVIAVFQLAPGLMAARREQQEQTQNENTAQQEDGSTTAS